MVPEKTSELGDKIDFTPAFLPRENATEGGELYEHRVNNEPVIDDAGDGRGSSKGSKLLHHSSGDMTESIVYPVGTLVQSTSFSPMRGS